MVLIGICIYNHGQFSVQSMYQFLINRDIPFTKKIIWKLKPPLKIKIFLFDTFIKGVY